MKRRPRTKKEALVIRTEKWPREYAQEIMDLPVGERKAAFEAIPEKFQSMTRQHCETISMIRKYHRRQR